MLFLFPSWTCSAPRVAGASVGRSPCSTLKIVRMTLVHDMVPRFGLGADDESIDTEAPAHPNFESQTVTIFSTEN